LQYDLVTGGDDGILKFWDIRAPSAPKLMIGAHNHWVWAAYYNGLKDQLLLSGGSDGKVALVNAASLSSDADPQSAASGNSGGVHSWPDGVLASFEEHDDSVYSAAWSSADPWIFASLSHDGRVVVNHVPRDTKYALLLAGSCDD
jgi:WD40 repeat protein